MAGGRHLRPDEAKLWQVVAGSVKPLANRPAPKPIAAASSLPTPSKPAAKPQQSKAIVKGARPAKLPVTPVTPPELPDASGHKRVRRGRLEVDARIDLHGMTRVQAEHALSVFIPAMRARGFGCVLVITGKGLDVEPEDYLAPQPGVIRRRLPEWLNGSRIRPHVTSYAPAHAKHGGSGAFYVLLKRRVG
jgi:DNA-nicking Smr family endonuclease